MFLLQAYLGLGELTNQPRPGWTERWRREAGPPCSSGRVSERDSERVCVRCVCMRRGGFLPAEAAVVSGKLPGTQCWAHYTTYFVCYQRAIPSN